MKQETENQECCPRFNPELWDNKIVEWKDKLFIRDSVCTFFFMPLNFGSVMKRMMKKIEVSETAIPDYLCLSDHTSKWNMDLYLAVEKEVANADNRKISGKFMCKVFEGNFNKTGEWCRDFEADAKAKGFYVKKWYMWYTTCPKCAKKYGKNYVAIIAEI